jgi:hypothetical protein
MKARIFLYAAQVLVTVLFLINFQRSGDNVATIVWSFLPLALVFLIILNSFWCTRFTSWLIFAGAFFGFLVTLSAFTVRWRIEVGFAPGPFYQSIFMFVLMVYIGLAQMKLHFKNRTNQEIKHE